MPLGGHGVEYSRRWPSPAKADFVEWAGGRHRAVAPSTALVAPKGREESWKTGSSPIQRPGKRIAYGQCLGLDSRRNRSGA